VSRNVAPRAARELETIVALAIALAILTALVVSGGIAALDQYAVDHWMPHLDPTGGSSPASLTEQFYPHLGSPLQTFCNLWTFPASIPVSGVVVGVCCLALARRGQRTAGLAWVSAWIVANAVEVIGKSVLHRPALHALEAGSRISFNIFAHTFPSGHTLRALIAAVVLATVWRRATWPAAAWAAIALPALVVNAAHTPSDVVGGALLAALMLLLTRRILELRAAAG
jgi:undecaprenyl-diphosphatase